MSALRGSKHFQVITRPVQGLCRVTKVKLLFCMTSEIICWRLKKNVDTNGLVSFGIVCVRTRASLLDSPGAPGCCLIAKGCIGIPTEFFLFAANMILNSEWWYTTYLPASWPPLIGQAYSPYQVDGVIGPKSISVCEDICTGSVYIAPETAEAHPSSLGVV